MSNTFFSLYLFFNTFSEDKKKDNTTIIAFCLALLNVREIISNSRKTFKLKKVSGVNDLRRCNTTRLGDDESRGWHVVRRRAV